MLIGSGTGVNTVLVVTLRFAPALSVMVMCCCKAYGAPSDVIRPNIVSASEDAPGPYSCVAFVSDGPAGQKAKPGGPSVFAVLTQLVKLVVPTPVVESVVRVLAKLMLGGVVGSAKSVDAIQISSVVAAVLVSSSVDPISCAKA